MPPDEFAPLERFLPHLKPSEPDTVTALSSGYCPVSGEQLSLPRTRRSEDVARRVMAELSSEEPKMFGILIVRSSGGRLGFLKAFSGQWKGRIRHPGWVPPMLELEPSSLEISTKKTLDEIKGHLKRIAVSEVYLNRKDLKAHWEAQAVQLTREFKQNKRRRDLQRQKGESESVLAAMSKEDSRRKREFKQQQAEALGPLNAVEREIDRLKKERKALSRALQAEMHARFEAGLWTEKPWSLASLFPSGPPTGTGECCAPKLLHFARQNNLEPVALAEFWWGESTEKRQKGSFYPPCVERCQPLLGPLLSDAEWSLRPVYSDDEILVVDKPSGLLTVPGREVWNQDSLVNRLQTQWGELHAVHRLDLETSGLVVLARSVSTLGVLQKTFQERQVVKTYEALLQGCPEPLSGRIEDPIGPAGHGLYSLCCPEGKAAVTEYRVLNSEQARVELKPLTGRSHQLRVHCAQSLEQPVVGDPLYGRADRRLMLHAKGLRFRWNGKTLELESPAPF